MVLDVPISFRAAVSLRHTCSSFLYKLLTHLFLSPVFIIDAHIIIGHRCTKVTVFPGHLTKLRTTSTYKTIVSCPYTQSHLHVIEPMGVAATLVPKVYLQNSCSQNVANLDPKLEAQWFGPEQMGPRGSMGTMISPSSGVSLRTYHWPAATDVPKGLVILVHGHGTYSEYTLGCEWAPPTCTKSSWSANGCPA